MTTSIVVGTPTRTLVALLVALGTVETQAERVPGKPVLHETKISVTGLAYRDEALWGFAYHGRGRYALRDLETKAWVDGTGESERAAIKEAAWSPGGACFEGDHLWISHSYGSSIACIDTNTWKVVRRFDRKHRDQRASQSYAAVAHDGEHLWVVWHSFDHSLGPNAQRLLKLDPTTGEVLNEYAAPAGTPRDGTHGLAWDGEHLWHVKDNVLSRIDPETGKVSLVADLEGVVRPSGLTWDGEALWIAEFSGRVWRVPFRDVPDSPGRSSDQ